MDVRAVQVRLAQFAADRDWDQFHSPKNLSMALAGEAGELLEIFQWLTEEESRNLDERTLAAASQEIADVAIHLLRLSDKLGIDLESAISDKIDLNARKYPIELARGSARKYRDEDACRK
jgi:NTP pyrophosphatase (non-canonical NTP hydrolase)